MSRPRSLHKAGGLQPVLIATVLACGIAACSSPAPIRYYTLVPAAAREALSAVEPARDPAFQFDLGSVTVPAQVDTPRFVLRSGDGVLTPVESQRWIAPLADEARAAIADALQRRLQVPDVSGVPANTALPLYRIRVRLRRFDSVLADSARIEAVWTVTAAADAKQTATCESSRTEPIGSGFDALATGHQRALASIAGGIAKAVEAIHAGRAAGACLATAG